MYILDKLPVYNRAKTERQTSTASTFLPEQILNKRKLHHIFSEDQSVGLYFFLFNAVKHYTLQLNLYLEQGQVGLC